MQSLDVRQANTVILTPYTAKLGGGSELQMQMQTKIATS